MNPEEAFEKLEGNELAEWLADYMIENDLSPQYTGEGSICDELYSDLDKATLSMLDQIKEELDKKPPKFDDMGEALIFCIEYTHENLLIKEADND